MNRKWILSCLLAASSLLASRPAIAADDDDDDTPAKPADTKPATTPAKPAGTVTPAKPTTPAKPADTTAAKPADKPADAPLATSTPAAPAPGAPNLNMVAGAPLSDPDVSVHIVQRKVLSDKGRHEVVLFPVVAQINGKFTNHLGLAAEYLYHFQENVALQISPNFFYSNGEAGFNEDLVRIARLQAQAATALTMQWGGEAGIEATPIYGKFAFYEGTMASFSLVLNAGVGITSTRVQLRPSDPDTGDPAVFGDTGIKFLGNIGGGFRIKVGEHFAIRLEVRDLIYTASVSSVNGCDSSDLDSIVAGQGALNASCNPDKFPKTSTGEQPDASLAKALLKVPSSDVLNQVAFYGGVAYIF